MALVQLRQVRKTYQSGQTQVAALRGIDLEVASQEFTVLMGPKKSGKTTLLNIIGCVDRMDSGSYALDGLEIGGEDFNALAQVRTRKIGFIFQAFNLIPVLNVVENIEFPCLVRGDNKQALRARAEQKAHEVGLGDCLHHRPDALSGGQRQRVAIARALIGEPQLVLADEPTANLDAATSAQIVDLMLRLNREQQVTFLFSSRDPQVTQHARRVVRLANGALVS